MTRKSLLFIITILSAGLMACGIDIPAAREEAEAPAEQPETVEEVVDETTEVDDYSALTYSELEVLSYDGDPVAEYYLGQLYEYGTEDINQDFSKAISWYTESAAHDNADATTALGYFYLTGTGVDQDLEQATAYFDQAIEFGDINAKVGLARTRLAAIDDELLQQYVDVRTGETEVEDTQDTEETENTEVTEDTEWKSDDTDDVSETEDTETTEDTSETDYTELETQLNGICTLIRAAYAAKDVDGIYYMGYLYDNGLGVAADAVKATNCYEEAAEFTTDSRPEQDTVNMACVAMGLRYMAGNGVAKDEARALEYFQKASDNGDARAQYYMGQIYENGLGVTADYEQAMEYYRLSAESDFAPALNQIGYLYYNGYGVDVDFSSAVYYQKLAALQGYAPAQVNLGFLYENGYGVEADLSMALEYYELAAQEGYEGAQEAVIRVRAQLSEES